MQSVLIYLLGTLILTIAVNSKYKIENYEFVYHDNNEFFLCNIFIWPSKMHGIGTVYDR